ncbi:MAG: dihydropteroate synthase [Deltaproteobacteria bacterium]|nr:dihydropteroate synthase [Deltaproteobacteria bacterium]
MGIINVTPDSFSDGGKHFKTEDAARAAREMIRDGADVLDLGAETTRPGSLPITEEEEWGRLEPVLAALRETEDCPPISIDTYRAGTARKALDLGAAMINDVHAGRKDPEILDVAAEAGVPIVLMHMLGEPATMQIDPRYDDVVAEVREFLAERAAAAMARGIPGEMIILDPGIGFGKNADHNLTLVKNLPRVYPPGFVRLMALSRKAFLGKILRGAAPSDRDVGTAVLDGLSAFMGAHMVRSHNVALTSDAVKVAMAVRNGTPG